MDTTPQPDAAPQTIQWHTAFSQAIEAEFVASSGLLSFSHEFQLTSEALRVDCIIRLKDPAVTRTKNIARIFKGINIGEFKSPDDSFSVKDYFKVNAYASLYAALTPEADLRDTTLTFIGSRYPRTLIRYFREGLGYGVEEEEKGIYVVRGGNLPMQVIVTKRLSVKDNQWLRHLGRDLETREVKRILRVGGIVGKQVSLGAYFDALMRANVGAFQEVLEMSEESLSLETVLMESSIVRKWLEEREQRAAEREKRGQKRGAQQKAREVLELINQGYSLESLKERLMAEQE